MNLKAFKIIRTLTATFFAFFLIAAFPLAVSAAPAVTSLTVDRTTITQGQTITINIRATPQTTFVFATADGVRTQGHRLTGNYWEVTVAPARSTVVNVFANNANNETNAAVIRVPVTVTGAATPQLPSHNVQIPTPPANLAPLAIASITETPAVAANQVQLTVVTGAEVNEVWVNFNRVNNVRGTGRFVRGTMLSQDTNSRTWVLNIPLTHWTSQTVEVGANRTYNWPGATTRDYTLTLAQPFVPPVAPVIFTATPSTHTVSVGSPVTFTISTNLDAEHVWIRDMDGREVTAHRTTSTASRRNWTVTFHPSRTGSVTVFANATRTDAGAVTRSETITVGHVTAAIVGTPTATFMGNNNTFIQVVTNQHAETVWATMPGTGIRVQLHRSGTGTGDRTWTGWAHDIVATGNIVIGVSSQIGNVNVLSPEDTRTIVRGGTGADWISSAAHLNTSIARRGDDIDFLVRTSATVTNLTLALGGHATLQFAGPLHTNVGNNEVDWLVRVRITDTAPINQTLPLTIRAYVGTVHVSSWALPGTTIIS